jgi:two-component system, chemotaxis family, protein-glutamate methylesterase/glutaminase
MPRELVVVGASAGGVEALREVVSGLPADFPAAILIVLHVGPTSLSVLPQILGRAGRLPADHAVDRESIEPGRVLVAPPDRHLVVRDGLAVLDRGPRENGHRPAVDPLFRSAARWYGPAAMGVILSGTLDDGAAGAATLVDHGGRLLVQDPAEALYPGMPRAALRATRPSGVVPSSGIAGCLVGWAREQAASSSPGVEGPASEVGGTEFDPTTPSGRAEGGGPAALSCPDCGGAMYELHGGGVHRFRCGVVGHTWSPESLAAQQVEQAEGALWSAVRSLEETAALHRKLAEAAASRGSNVSATRHDERAEDAHDGAQRIRELIIRRPVAADRHEVSEP